MNRLVLPFAVLLLALSGQTARAQLGVRPVNPLSRPPVSPYLNLLRSGADPAINYYGLVRPQLETQAAVNQLQTALATQPLTDNTPLVTQPIINTGTGASFLTYNRYFLTAGRPGTSTAGSIRTSIPAGVPGIGLAPR